jgi:hypothetical protein
MTGLLPCDDGDDEVFRDGVAILIGDEDEGILKRSSPVSKSVTLVGVPGCLKNPDEGEDDTESSNVRAGEGVDSRRDAGAAVLAAGGLAFNQ